MIGRKHDANALPDLVILVDPTEIVYELSVGWEPKFGAILCDTMVDTRALDRWKGKLFFFHIRSAHKQHDAWKELGLPIWDRPWLTSGEIVTEVANGLNPGAVFVMGIDYADLERTKVNCHKMTGLSGEIWTNLHYYFGSKYSGDVFSEWSQRFPVVRASYGLGVAGCTQIRPEGSMIAVDEMTKELGPKERWVCPPASPHPEWRRLLLAMMLEGATDGNHQTAMFRRNRALPLHQQLTMRSLNTALRQASTSDKERLIRELREEEGCLITV